MIDVAFTRADLRRADVAVVIDVLRATSTIAQALAAGYRSVLCADGVERARALRAPGRILAGEQRCVMPPGFDMGNSPLEATRRYGERLILATTNGAPTIVAATRHAPVVLTACLLNLDAVLDKLADLGVAPDGDLQVVCSGTGDAAAVEDVYVAGRICDRLDGRRSDATHVAEAVARSYPTARDALRAGANARVLMAAGLDDDIAYCSRESKLGVVPSVLATTSGVAIVAPHVAVDASRAAPATRAAEGLLTR